MCLESQSNGVSPMAIMKPYLAFSEKQTHANAETAADEVNTAILFRHSSLQ